MDQERWALLHGQATKVAIEEYSSEASSIIRLTQSEISEIINEASVDKRKLSELVSVVDDASKSNHEKAEAIRNTTGLAEVAASMIGKLV